MASPVIPSLFKASQFVYAKEIVRDLKNLDPKMTRLSIDDDPAKEIDINSFPNLQSLAYMPDLLVPGVIGQMDLKSMTASELKIILSLLPEKEKIDLDLKGCDISLIDFSTLPSSLHSLKVSHISQEQLDALSIKCPNIFFLEITSSHQIESLDSLKEIAQLKSLHIYNCHRLEKFPENMNNLRYLEVVNCRLIPALPQLSEYPLLQILKVSQCGSIKRFPLMPRDHPIEKISIRHCYGIREIPPVLARNLKNFQCVGIKAKQVLYFGDCPKLEHVELSFCRQLLNLIGLHPNEGVPKLFSVKSQGIVKHIGVHMALQNLPRYIFLIN